MAASNIWVDPRTATKLTSWDNRRNEYRFARFGDLGSNTQARIEQYGGARVRQDDIVRFTVDGEYLGWNEPRKYIKQGFRVAEMRILV